MSTGTAAVSPETAEELRQFVLREARLLDEGRLPEWLDLLADDVEYYVPLAADPVAPDHLAIVHEDRFRLEARVWRTSQTGINHSQDPPSRTVRSVGGIEIDPGPGEETTLRFATVLYEWRPGGQRTPGPLTVLPMRCTYRVRRVAEDWRITYRRLDLLQRDGELPPMTYVL